MTTGGEMFRDLRVCADIAPQRRAIVCADQQLTYGQLEAEANRTSELFRRMGLVRGDHIATLIGNRPEMLVLAWAAWRTGLYLTPMATSLTATELAYLAADCTAKVVIADAALATVASTLGTTLNGDVTLLSMGGEIAGFIAMESLLASLSPLPHADEPPGALMMYTSGTTGKPKGVYRPLLPADWRGTPPFAADLITLFDVGGANVRYLQTAPLYHAASLRFALAVTAGGGTAFVMTRFDAHAALSLIEREAITHSQWVPAMFQRLLSLPDERRRLFKAPAHGVAIHGAAPCPPAVKKAMIDWWGPILLEYYSGSEGIGLTLINSVEALQRPGSVGRARKGTLHIAGDGGLALAAHHTGLVCFSGIAPFSYFNAPDKTAARTLPQGWQTFGDIGYIDDEGYLYLTDRSDDVIISGGVNIYPQEIESAIRDVAGVWDCAVVGAPDERFGERPVAFVVPARDGGRNAPSLHAAVQFHCEGHLGRFKRPDAIHVIDSLPRSPMGKLLRRQLRERANDTSATSGGHS